MSWDVLLWRRVLQCFAKLWRGVEIWCAWGWPDGEKWNVVL